LKELDRNVSETEVDQTDADQTDANPGTDYKDICWQDGRRIVELKALAEQLNACDGCDSPLKLMNIEQERLHGFGSYLSIRCTTCNLLNTVVTILKYTFLINGGGIYVPMDTLCLYYLLTDYWHLVYEDNVLRSRVGRSNHYF
jgi:hypothetical protein